MHAVHTPELGHPSFPTATALASPSERSRPAWWGRQSPTPSFIVVSAHGDMYAANAGKSTDCIRRQTTLRPGLVQDLHGANLPAIDEYSALDTISVVGARMGTGRALVPGAAAPWMLGVGICHPQDELPVGTVETSLALFGEQYLPPPRSAADVWSAPSAA